MVGHMYSAALPAIAGCRYHLFGDFFFTWLTREDLKDLKNSVPNLDWFTP